MNRIVISMLGLSLAAIVCWAAEPKPKAGDDDAAQLKAAQAERVELLTLAVKILTAQYQSGTTDFLAASSAEKDLCDAQLDLTNETEQRIALLTAQLDKTNDLLKVVQAKFDAGTTSEADVVRAKSLCLGIKIRLLQERSRKTPTRPDANPR